MSNEHDTQPLEPTLPPSPKATPARRDDETIQSPTPAAARAPIVSEAGASQETLASPIVARHAALPAQIGSFKILSLLGVGGMGAVYEAQQARPNRTVALKVIKPGFVSASLLKRFEREAEVLGRLQHPGIAQVYEAGTAHEGGLLQPYFAMELVRGTSLTRHANDNHLELRARLELVTRVCDAVQYAHQQGVVHRDLKPGNILVDATGQPKVLDFGLAKIAGNEAQLTTMETQVGQLVGTLPYMSPEQARGEVDKLDTRSDIYAMGVIAYELLAGKLPYDLKQAVVIEAVRIICEDEPTPLSNIDRKYGGDVQTIIAKAMAKERERRYASASELASDIRRYLNDQPIAARPASTWYQASKFARRHKALVGGLAAVFLVLVLGMATTTWQAVRARAALEVAEAQRRAAEEARAATVTARQATDEARSAATQNEAAAVTARDDSRRNAIDAADGLVSLGDRMAFEGKWVEAKAAYREAREKYVASQAAPDRADQALCEAYSTSPPAILTLSGHTAPVLHVAFGPDGRTALSGSRLPDMTLKLWDLPTGRVVRTFVGHSESVGCVAISPDGRTALSCSPEKTLRLWDLSTGKNVRTFIGHADSVNSVAFSPDGRSALSGSGDKTLKLWDLETGEVIRTLTGHTKGVGRVAFSPDGRTALSGSVDKSMKLWDLTTGKELRNFNVNSWVYDVAISPNGRVALSGSEDKTLRLWDLETGEVIRTFTGHTGGVWRVTFSPDGRTALSSSGDTIKHWDLSTGIDIRTLTGHAGRVGGVPFSPDGRTAISCSWDKTLKLWDLSTGREVRTLTGHIGAVKSVAISPDGRTAMSGASEATTITVGDTSYRAGFGGGKNFKFWDLATGKTLRSVFGHEHFVDGVAFGPDGRTALTGGSGDEPAKLWDLASGKTLRVLAGHSDSVFCVALSPDGREALSGSTDKTLKLWDVASGNEIRTLTGHTDRVHAAAFSPDGRRAISASNDKTLKLWDLSTGKEVRTFAGHTGPVRSVAHSADGRTALSGGEDKTLKLWDLSTGMTIRTFTGHSDSVSDYVMGVAFAPDGRTVFSAGMDKSIKAWDLNSGKEIRTFLGHSDYISSIALSRDGHTLLSGSADKTLNVRDFSRVPRFLEFETTMPMAQSALDKDPNDSAALAVLGNWYAFRGLNGWAVELLEKARSGGAEVAPLILARCYWEMADDLPFKSSLTRADCLSASGREYAKAMTATKDEKERTYLELCAKAVRREASQPATTRPTNGDGEAKTP
ncbi:MAG: protein kinase [Planctomycetota bacterium]|nr:protein kinase [Planctomycetota bacterium]